MDERFDWRIGMVENVRKMTVVGLFNIRNGTGLFQMLAVAIFLFQDSELRLKKEMMLSYRKLNVSLHFICLE